MPPRKVDEAAALHVPQLGVAGLLDEEVMGLAHAPGHGGVAAGEEGGVGEVAVLLHGVGVVDDEEMKEWGGFWKSRHTPSMYRAALFGAHCAGLKSCTGNP